MLELQDVGVPFRDEDQDELEIHSSNLDGKFRIENINVEVYAGRITDNGTIENISIIPMTLVDRNDENREYTFRVMPKHEMLLDSENLDLIKWITQ